MDIAFGSGPEGCGFDPRRAQDVKPAESLDFTGLEAGYYFFIKWSIDRYLTQNNAVFI